MYSTLEILKKIKTDGWKKGRWRDVGWRVTARVQPPTNFNIHPSILIPPSDSLSDGGRKRREPNQWEVAQKLLT